MKRKKGASNELGAAGTCDPVWRASASRSWGQRKCVQEPTQVWSVDHLTVKERRPTGYVRTSMPYGGRLEFLFPVRFNLLRSFRVVSLSSDLVGRDAVSRGAGARLPEVFVRWTDPLGPLALSAPDLC